MYLDLFGYFEKGHLPYSGGTYNQPAHILSRLKYVGYLRNEFMKKKTEKDNRNKK